MTRRGAALGLSAFCLFLILPHAPWWGDGEWYGSLRGKQMGGSQRVNSGGLTAARDLGREGSPWLSLGPFSAAANRDASDPIDRDWLSERGGEDAADPAPIQDPAGMSWFPLESSDGRLSFPEAATRGGAGVYYAFRRLDPGRERSVQLAVTCRAPVKVYIDGRAVYARYDFESRGGRQERIFLHLSGQERRLLVKLDCSRGDPDFSLTLLPAEESGQTSAGDAELQPGLALRPLAREFRPGQSLSAVIILLGRGEAPPARSLPSKRIEIGAYDASGQRIATAVASAGESFELALPPGHEGVVELRSTSCEGLPPVVYVGSLARALDAALARAQAALASLPKAAAGRGDWDEHATLQFLAALLGTGEASPLGTFDELLNALTELDAITALGTSPLPRGRLWRLALSSGLDGEPLPYCRWQSATPGSHPVLVGFHDRGETDFDAARRMYSLPGLGEAYDFLLPYGGRDASFQGPWEDLLKSELALAEGGAPSSARRPILIGWGWGATAATLRALLEPGSWAGLASFGGRAWREELSALRGLPVLLVAGSQDRGLGPEALQDLGARLGSAGARLKLARIEAASPEESWEAWAAGVSEGRESEAQDAAGNRGRLLSWLGEAGATKEDDQSGLYRELLSPFPRYGSAPGFRIRAARDPFSPSRVKLEVPDPRHLLLSTVNVSLLELKLPELELAGSGSIVAELDGRSFVLDAGGTADFSALDGAPLAQEETGAAPERGGAPGASPPAHDGEGLAALFHGKLALVYGTRRRADEVSLRNLAGALAARIGGAAGLSGWPLILADREAAGALDPDTSLLLIGDPAQNSLLAERAEALGLRAGRRGVSFQGRPLGPGFLLVRPDPGAANRLLGILALPFPEKQALELADGLLGPWLGGGREGAMDSLWRTPDLVAWNRDGLRYLEAEFDASWRSLSFRERP